MTTAIKTAVELVHFQPENPRGTEMFRALSSAASAQGVELIESTAYRGIAPWLMVWGPGNPTRRDTIAAHVATGGHAICFDLAYWQRDRKIRVSFDAPHPQAYVMRSALSADRLVADGIVLTNEWNPAGPVVIAGLGPKALVQYGKGAVSEWEGDMMRACAARWPMPIIYRPKKDENDAPAWATQVSRGGAIETVLRGASLVITWHSNVAVDAIRMGIPVVCRDGAAAAVCPSTLPDEIVPRPLATVVRDQFLANLAWFQWRPSEARGLWRFATEMLS